MPDDALQEVLALEGVELQARPSPGRGRGTFRSRMILPKKFSVDRDYDVTV
jgi:hypothetical protein